MISLVVLLQWSSELIAKGTASQIVATITTLRLGAAGEQTLNNPQWVKFLLFDNTGFSPDANDALVRRLLLVGFVAVVAEELLQLGGKVVAAGHRSFRTAVVLVLQHHYVGRGLVVLRDCFVVQAAPSHRVLGE